ncbi:hypothetical protein [Nocardia sp. NPDC050406]|uniref:hypothetical protein n=1 Tax=Nocardia sp. NPDC050406 TaxID=3364318 RepID=UPI00378743E2
MQRSALLLVTTAGIILAGTAATEILGDESGPPPAVRSLSQQSQHFVLEAESGAIQPAACVKLSSGRYAIQPNTELKSTIR